ncbi:CDP-glycerol glycerophosphotransferase family protein [Arthrobacter sp. CAN_A1]|uniref:CDP-glycerol glycerophosphotransferase family protein n=1 Tax=Arthrobacter sp. CAN_A1 TaxID=2787717 RepID=UPI0018CB8A3B
MSNWQARFQEACELENTHDWAAVADAFMQLQCEDSHLAAEVQYRIGHAQFHLSNFEAAARRITSAVEVNPNMGRWHFLLGYVRERQHMYALAEEQYQEALKLEPGHERWEHKLTSVRETRRRRIEIESAEQEEICFSYRAKLDLLLEDKAPKWQVIDLLTSGKPFFKRDAAWLTTLGDALFFMNRFAEAAEEFSAAADLGTHDADLLFKAGWAHLRAGSIHPAQRFFEQATSTDKMLEAHRFGVGAFFQKKGQWRLAAEHYAQTLRRNPTDATLAYRMGFALQRCYEWEAGANAIRTAIALDHSEPRWHYRLGFSLERLGRLSEAVNAYTFALEVSPKPNEYWAYRLGYVLTKERRFEEACTAFARSPLSPQIARADQSKSSDYLESLLLPGIEVAKATQSSDRCASLALRAQQYGLPVIAAASLQAAVARSEKHDSRLYFSLGSTLASLGRFEDATAAYLETRLLKRPHGVDTANYFKDKSLKQSIIYVEYLETLKILDNVVLYESSHGSSVGCNPLNIFRSISNDHRFNELTHVWVLNDRTRVPSEMLGLPNVVFVARDSDLYMRYLASAKFLINNNTFPPYFSRRPEQKYLNTWHGTPMKTLGKDIKGGFMEHRNATRNFLHATHILAPNEFTAQSLLETYDIAEIYPGKVAVTGYPRVDSTVNLPREQAQELRTRLGVPPGEKVVLYAPTWRGTLSNRELDNDRLLRDIRVMAKSSSRFLFRGHPVTEAQLNDAGITDHLVPADIDTNDLLGIVDVLITDYSSIAFDFMATQRPIIYYAYDLAEYEADRGLCLDISSLPGSLCLQAALLPNSIAEALASDEESTIAYREAADKYVSLEQGESSKRAVEFFFFDSAEFELAPKTLTRKNVLMFQGSFIPNGITASYLNLVSHLEPDDVSVFLTLEPGAVATDERRREKFEQNPGHVKVLPRVGSQLIGAEERWVVDKFNSQGHVAGSEQWSIYRAAFAREFRRMFGSAQFDAVVCFEGYARFWAALFANAPGDNALKSIFLHNDMHSEWRHRFKYLESMFRLYGEYDSLISVTKSVAEENRKKLSGMFDLDSDRFEYSNNLVNADETVALSKEPVPEDIETWMGNCSKVFVTAGRLSPEKDHAKLIASFAKVAEDNDQIKLIILGDGPLRVQLEKQINSLEMSSKVLLAGLRLNPFPVIRRGDCFVFSSNYEGQGLAVLEALILGKPVISTDVVGPRSVLENGYGLLVENSIDGLANGMSKFLDSWSDYRSFDYLSYERESLHKFTSITFGQSLGDRK